MNVNHELIKQLRLDRGWTQQQLADVADLSLRTVQRVEKLGVASMESVNALCSVLSVERNTLLTQKDSASLRHAKVSVSVRQKLSYVLVFAAGLVTGGALVAWLIK